MVIDIPHILATAVILFVSLYISEKMGWREKGSRKFSWELFGLLFVLMLLLNLVWPYGSGA